MSGENKKELRVLIEGLGELYQGLSNGPLDLARLLDPADLRGREAARRASPRMERRARTRASLITSAIVSSASVCIVAPV